jgi:hypothetical protein
MGVISIEIASGGMIIVADFMMINTGIQVIKGGKINLRLATVVGMAILSHRPAMVADNSEPAFLL